MIALWIVCVVATADVAPPAFSAANDELAAYLAEAGENHPALRARYSEWRAALERIPQATSLDDPMFTYGQFVQSDFNRFKLGLAQKFPWFGTLRTRGDKAAAEADAALERFYSVRNKVFAEVKAAYFEYGFLGERIRVTEAQVEILRYMEDVVRSKYSLGMAGEDDLLRVEIERAKVQDRLDGLSQLRPALAAKLAETVGRQAVDVLPWPQAADLPSPPPSIEAVLARVREANPDLAVLDRLVESHEKQAALAARKGRPDMTLELEYLSISRPRQIRPDRPFPSSLYGARRLLTGTTAGAAGALIDLYSVAYADEPMSYGSGGDDNIMLSLRLNLPIWRKRIRAGIREAQLKREATEHEKRRKTLALDSAAHLVLFQVQDARRRFDLYGDVLLPKAQQSYEALQNAYATGARAGFLDLMDSVQTLLAFDLERLAAARDLHVAAAGLALLMGGPADRSIAKIP